MKRLIVCWVHFGQIVLLGFLTKTQGGTEEDRHKGNFGELAVYLQKIFTTLKKSEHAIRGNDVEQSVKPIPSEVVI